MIRIIRVDALDRPTFEIHRSGKLVKSAGDVESATMHLAGMGVDKPRPLVEAALQWGTVDICEPGEDGRRLPLL